MQMLSEGEKLIFHGIDISNMGHLGGTLKKMGILKPEGNAEYLPCPSPDCEETGRVEKIKNDFWVNCSDHCMKLHKIDPEDVKTWFFDLECFLKHLKLKLNVSGELYMINKSLWCIGNKGGVQLYLVLKEDLKAREIAEEGINLLMTPIRTNRRSSICLADFISLKEDGFHLDQDLIEMKLKGIRSEAKKNDQKLEQPTYSYAGVEIYCQEKPPYNITMIKVKGGVIGRNEEIRRGDLRVLKRLVMAKGVVVSKLGLAEAMKEDQNDPDKKANTVEGTISRLRKIGGINIKTYPKEGYSLEK